MVTQYQRTAKPYTYSAQHIRNRRVANPAVRRCRHTGAGANSALQFDTRNEGVVWRLEAPVAEQAGGRHHGSGAPAQRREEVAAQDQGQGGGAPGADADPAADTAAEAIRGAGQRFAGMGTDGESDTSQPRQRRDDKPPGVLQTARTGRGSGSRREAGTGRGSIANGCEATTPAYT